MKTVESESADGKHEVILLVGASADIGLEVIRRLDVCCPGARILAHYNRSGEKLARLASSLKQTTITPIQADLSTSQGVEQLVSSLREIPVPPTKVVHLAAPKFRYLRFKDASWDDFQRELDIQLRSVVRVTQHVLPVMAQRREGKIVIVLSSVTIGVPPAALAHYVTIKYALLGLVRALAAEYNSKRININAVSPSMVETAFLDELPARLVEITSEQSPWGRIAHSTEIAGVISFLLSKDADYITGANIPVSGGTTF